MLHTWINGLRLWLRVSVGFLVWSIHPRLATKPICKGRFILLSLFVVCFDLPFYGLLGGMNWNFVVLSMTWQVLISGQLRKVSDLNGSLRTCRSSPTIIDSSRRFGMPFNTHDCWPLLGEAESLCTSHLLDKLEEAKYSMPRLPPVIFFASSFIMTLYLKGLSKLMEAAIAMISRLASRRSSLIAERLSNEVTTDIFEVWLTAAAPRHSIVFRYVRRNPVTALRAGNSAITMDCDPSSRASNIRGGDIGLSC